MDLEALERQMQDTRSALDGALGAAARLELRPEAERPDALALQAALSQLAEAAVRLRNAALLLHCGKRAGDRGRESAAPEASQGQEGSIPC